MTGQDDRHMLPPPSLSPQPRSVGIREAGFMSWSPADYFRLLNINTAKVFAILLVGGFTLYHSLLHAIYGVTPCKGLLNDGMYKGRQWQPWGCMMHKYTRTDSERCFRYSRFWGKRNHLVYVGDTRVKQLYSATRVWLESGTPPVTYQEDVDQWDHESTDLSWENSAQNLKLEFIWAPAVNLSMLHALERWSKGPGPTVLILGAGLLTVRESNGSLDALEEYGRNLTRIKPELENIMEFGGTKVLWAPQAPVNYDYLNGTDKAITNHMVWKYNGQVERVLGKSGVITWSSLYRLGEGTLDEMTDGVHFTTLALSQATQMILNLVCNDNMNFNDGSCCKSSDHPTSLQVISFAILGTAVAITILIFVYETMCKQQPSHRYPNYEYQPMGPPPATFSLCQLPSNHFTNFVFPLAKLAVILAYFYVCDRTNFFMKENKYFTPVNFWLPVLYLTVIGLFFNEESSYTSILHRDQTDEWKGWMQLIILVYHMTGASTSIPIYLCVRVLISAYLFLIGYTHFSHFWSKGKTTGLPRFMQVLFRMNFLTFVLCLCMNRPYQFYYFAPLVSFWFLVLFCLLVCPPVIYSQTVEDSGNPVTHYLYVLLKFAALVTVISTFYMSEVFFEKVFVTRPWKALFVTTDDDIHEWWFRWKLDRYSMVYGSIFSVAVIVAGKFKLYDDSNHGSLWPRSISVFVSIAAFVGLASYIVFAGLCRNKAEGNEVHSYIVFIPIVSFVILRNLTGIVRSRYSTFFAWFGKINLELFIAQYHIWLSADSHGVLVLVPNYPVFNILITSFIFVCACHEIHIITNQLFPYFVPMDPLLAMRNIVVFILILVPIGIHDGMF